MPRKCIKRQKRIKKCEKKPSLDLKLVKDFLEPFKPKLRDLKRPMSEWELKLLCINVPCCVELFRWNILHPHMDIDDNDMMKKQKREHEWAMRKKEHLLLLKVWRYESRCIKKKEHQRMKLLRRLNTVRKKLLKSYKAIKKRKRTVSA